MKSCLQKRERKSARFEEENFSVVKILLQNIKKLSKRGRKQMVNVSFVRQDVCTKLGV